MPWGRVDDTYYDHPKLDQVEALHGPLMRLAVAGLNALAWSYCNRFLTDGLLVSRAVAKLGAMPEVVAAAVECELWDAVPTGYQVHDFLDHNDSREVILARREKEAKRKADWRAGKGAKAGPDGTEDEPTHDVPPGQPKRPAVRPGVSPGGTRARAQRARDATRSANPVPSRPVPSSRKKESVPVNGAYPASAEGEPLLDKRELEAWHPFRRSQWAGFRSAWLARGFKLPPAGDPDDPRSQAHVAWEILDARGDELAQWVAEAPGKTSHDVVRHLLERWQAIKAEAGIEDEPGPDVERDPTSTPESAKDVLGRLVGAAAARPDWLGGQGGES